MIPDRFTGYAKRLSNKAAASEDPKAYPRGYVELLSEARTKLADFFSILQEIWRSLAEPILPCCLTSATRQASFTGKPVGSTPVE